MDRKFYSFETLFVDLANELRYYLRHNRIYYELSEGSFDMGSGGYHFEILATQSQAQGINAWLDENTIWCKGVQ